LDDESVPYVVASLEKIRGFRVSVLREEIEKRGVYSKHFFREYIPIILSIPEFHKSSDDIFLDFVGFGDFHIRNYLSAF